MTTLTNKQAETLQAFIAAFEELGDAWSHVEKTMCDDWSIEDPAAALEDALEALTQ